jgi:Tfp pilus assembly protein PilF
VPLFARRPRTRAELVAAADQARGRGGARKAAALYQEALRDDPDDPIVNARLAPLLARLGDADGGARAFRRAIAAHLASGFLDRAAGVVAAACAALPLEPSFRLEAAQLNLRRGRQPDALAVLVDGARTLARAGRREAAVALLRRALDLEPLHVEAVLAIAPLLASSGGRAEARALVARLEAATRGARLARVRWAAFRLRPTPRALWRWARARAAGARAS